MKRNITITFLVLMSVFCILFVTSCSDKTPIEINYQEPSKEISDKIYNAVKVDGARVFSEMYSVFGNEEKVEDIKEISNLKAFAEIDGNYLVYYIFDNHVLDIVLNVKLGDYALSFCNGCGNGIYSAKEDKLFSYKEAYEKQIITDKVLAKLYTDSKMDTLASIRMYELILGDINLNGKIDESDLSSLEMAIEQDENFYPFAREVGDMNGDGVADSKDIEILSKKVKKNK